MKKRKINLGAVSVAVLCSLATFGAFTLPSRSGVSAAQKTDTETVTVGVADSLALIVTPPSSGATTCGAATTCDPNNIEVDPVTSAIATGWSDTYASTNNVTGASLTISMVCDDSDTAMAGCQDQNTNTLVGITDNTVAINAYGTAAAATFSTNEWAYRYFDITAAIAAITGHTYDIDTDAMTDIGTDADYAAVPLFASPRSIWTTTSWSAAGSKTIRNVYGAKADNTLTPQDYTNNVLFTLSTNP